MSFPGFGWAGTDNEFKSVDDTLSWLDLVYNKYGRFDVLMGHSTGGLVGIAYTHKYPERIGRLILSSPWVDHYGDPTSYMPEWVICNIIRMVSYIYPSYNFNGNAGKYNVTSVGEFLYTWDNGLRLFDIQKKQLVDVKITARHLRTIFDWQSNLQSGSLRIPDTVPVDIWTSDKSAFWQTSSDKDNAVDVEDIIRYVGMIGHHARHHMRKGTIHNQFIVDVRDIVDMIS